MYRRVSISNIISFIISFIYYFINIYDSYYFIRWYSYCESKAIVLTDKTELVKLLIASVIHKVIKC